MWGVFVMRMGGGVSKCHIWSLYFNRKKMVCALLELHKVLLLNVKNERSFVFLIMTVDLSNM